MAITFFARDPNVSRSIGAYNAGLTEETVSRMREAVALEEARLRAQAQGQALQQQGRQDQQLNALRQQEIQNESAYRQGLLTNQRALSENELAWRKAISTTDSSEAEKDRQLKLKIAGLAHPDPNVLGPLALQEQNLVFNQSKNYADARNELERLNDALSRVTELEAIQNEESKLPQSPGTLKRFTNSMVGFPFNTYAQMLGFDPLGAFETEGFKTMPTKANGREIRGVNFSAVKGRLQQQIDSIGENLRNTGRLASTVTKGPQGWVSSLPAPATMSATNAIDSHPFFNSGRGSASGTNTGDVLQEARDAIAKGADPSAVGERLQSQFGMTLPPTRGFFDQGIGSSPATNAPATSGGYFNQGTAEILPIREASAPRGFFERSVIAPAPVQSTAGAMITVRTSDGRILRGPESSWTKLKAQDPGAEIVAAAPVRGSVMPIPGTEVPQPRAAAGAPVRRGFFGESFPTEFSNLGR